MALEIELIPAFSDNYMYLVHDPGSGVTAAVDPADSAAVLARSRSEVSSWISY